MSDDMLRSVSIQHGGDILSAMLGNTLVRIVGDEAVVQIPVFASGRVGHIYLSTDEYDRFVNSAMVQEMIYWLDKNDVAAEEMYEDLKEAEHE